MAKPILDEALWAVLELLLPPDPPRPRGGRPRIPAPQVLTGILFVLRSGIPWELLPQELGCGSGMTCWRRLQEWQVRLPRYSGSPALCVVGVAPRGEPDGLRLYIRDRCTNIFRFRTAGSSRSPAQGRKGSSSPSGRPDLRLLVRPA